MFQLLDKQETCSPLAFVIMIVQASSSKLPLSSIRNGPGGLLQRVPIGILQYFESQMKKEVDKKKWDSGG